MVPCCRWQSRANVDEGVDLPEDTEVKLILSSPP
jgi:hypothetical protein